MMKVVIVGGVAGGAGTAARLRRNDETAEIIMLERGSRSEEHTSELQSHHSISYAVFCLKKIFF